MSGQELEKAVEAAREATGTSPGSVVHGLAPRMVAAAAPLIQAAVEERVREALKGQAAEYRREATGSGREKMLAAAEVVDCVTRIVFDTGEATS